MPSSIARLTATDHDRMLRLVRRACSPGPSQDRWRAELVHLVIAHHDAERQVLSAEAATPAGPGTAAALEDLWRLDEVLLQAVRELESLPSTAPAPEVTRTGDALRELLTRHADLLAIAVLAPMTESLPRKLMRELGGQYAERRDEMLHQVGADIQPPRRLDVSRAELYELAKRAGIEGRSSMSRRDLILELQRRQQEAH